MVILKKYSANQKADFLFLLFRQNLVHNLSAWNCISQFYVRGKFDSLYYFLLLCVKSAQAILVNLFDEINYCTLPLKKQWIFTFVYLKNFRSIYLNNLLHIKKWSWFKLWRKHNFSKKFDWWKPYIWCHNWII